MATTIGTSNHRAAYKPQVSLSGNSQLSSQQRLNNLFQQIDTTGKGHITKAQFEQAFNKLSLPAAVKDLGPEVVLNKLDPNGAGIITKPEFMQRMEPLMNQKAAPAKEEAVEVKSTSESGQTNTDEMSPLDGFALGNIIDIKA
jgi:Ca2+-binding EF-hand superfamily protein